MYLGKIVEIGKTSEIFNNPKHPYTKALLSAAPQPDPRTERTRKRILLEGDLPSPINPPSGCVFRTRCWKANDKCASQEPILTASSGVRSVACHFPEQEVTLFIDLQVNGHSGIDFLNATSKEQIQLATKALKKEGVTGFLASLITSDLDQLKRASALVNEVAISQGLDEAKILGLHFEGPCLSKCRPNIFASSNP